VKDDVPSKEQTEESEGTVDEINGSEQDSSIPSKEYRAAAMEFTAKGSVFNKNQEVAADSTPCECTEGEYPCACEDDAHTRPPQVEKLIKAIAQGKTRADTKQDKEAKLFKAANDAVKNIQDKAGVVVKQVSIKQEEVPGGLIDLMSKAIATKAQVDEERASSRNAIETMVKTRIAASDSTQKTTRDALSAGFKVTKNADQMSNEPLTLSKW